MKILFFSNVFPNAREPHRGAFNRLMVRTLAERHDLRVIAPVLWTRAVLSGGTAPLSAADLEHVAVHHPRYFYTPKCFRDQYGRFMWWSVARSVKRALRDFSPDVVVAFWAHPDGEAAIRAARIAGVPGIVIVGGSDVLVIGRDVKRRQALRRVFEEADAIVAVSEHLKRAVIDCGISPEKIFVNRTGIDGDRFFPGDRDAPPRRLGFDLRTRMLLWVGHMVPVKGLPQLMQACAHLKSAGEEFHLDLIGDGPDRSQIKRLRYTLGLEACVSLRGPVHHASLPDWYRAADRTVMSSHSEGVPNVLLESMACGTPFVATRVGGIPEVAMPGLDVLVEPGDPRRLAEGISAALAARICPQRAVLPPDARVRAQQLTEILEWARARHASAPGAPLSMPRPASSEAPALEKACI